MGWCWGRREGHVEQEMLVPNPEQHSGIIVQKSVCSSSGDSPSTPVVDASRDWDSQSARVSQATTDLRASNTSPVQAVPKRSARSLTGRSLSATRAGPPAPAGLVTYSNSDLPNLDTRVDIFSVLRVDSGDAASPGGAIVGDAQLLSAYSSARHGADQPGGKACLPGATSHNSSTCIGALDHILSPAFCSRRAMAGFTILQTSAFASVLRAQLLIDPLLAWALQRALRLLTALQPRPVHHALADADAGGSAGVGLGEGALHILRLTPCNWAHTLPNGVISTSPALLLHYYLPYQSPSSMPADRTVGHLVTPLRDACILERVPNVITMIDCAGRVLYQNEASISYLGDWSSAHCAETLLAADAAAKHDRGSGNGSDNRRDDSAGVSMSSTSSGGSGGAALAPPRSALDLLLVLEPGCVQEIFAVTMAGQRWSGRVRVPASVKTTIRTSAQLPVHADDSLTSPSYGGTPSSIKLSPRAAPVSAEDEDAVFAGCFSVRSRSAMNGGASTPSPLSPIAHSHPHPGGLPHLSSYSPTPLVLGAHHTAGIMRTPPSGLPPAMLPAQRNDSASFLVMTGRMDSRSDSHLPSAPQRRIVALLGGAGAGSGSTGGSHGNSNLRGPGSAGDATSLGRGGSLPKSAADSASLPHSDSSLRGTSLLKPAAPPGGMERVPSNAASGLSVSSRPDPQANHNLLSPAGPSPAPMPAPASSPAIAPAHNYPPITPSVGLAAAAKRIHFWDGTPEAAPEPAGDAGALQPLLLDHPGTAPVSPNGTVPTLEAERSSPGSRPERPVKAAGEPSKSRRNSMFGGHSGILRSGVSTSVNSPAPGSGFGGANSNEDCWHEMHAIPLTDPQIGKPAILLVQMDVTRQVLSEERLADLTDAQLIMLEQLFPRHVIEYMLSHAPSTLSRNLGQLASYHPQVTITFFDIVGFTSMSRLADARQVLVFLNDLYTRFDELIDKYQLYKIDVVGDCYIVCAGLITKDVDGFERVQQDGDVTPEEAAWQARSVMAFCKNILIEANKVKMPNGEPTKLRVGLHCGPVVSGLVGPKMPKFTCLGDSMNFASRMESTGKPGCIQASAVCAGLMPEERWVLTSGVQVKGIGTVDTFIWNPELDASAASPSPPPMPERPTSMMHSSSVRKRVSHSSSTRLLNDTAAPTPMDSPAPSGIPTSSNRRVSSGFHSRDMGGGGGGGGMAPTSELHSAVSTASIGGGILRNGASSSCSNRGGSRPSSAHGNVPLTRRGTNSSGGGGDIRGQPSSAQVGVSRQPSGVQTRPQSGRGLRAQLSTADNDPMAHSLLTVLAHIREAYIQDDESDEEEY